MLVGHGFIVLVLGFNMVLDVAFEILRCAQDDRVGPDVFNRHDLAMHYVLRGV